MLRSSPPFFRPSRFVIQRPLLTRQPLCLNETEAPSSLDDHYTPPVMKMKATAAKPNVIFCATPKDVSPQPRVEISDRPGSPIRERQLDDNLCAPPAPVV